jgi:hypothetical protein
MTTNTARILNDAADLIDLHGWCQGTIRSVDGCYCIVGAVDAAANVDGGWGYRDARDAVSREVDSSMLDKWNDRPDRTKDQVTTALRNAAIKAT